MARLEREQAQILEEDLTTIFQRAPETTYQEALEEIWNRHPEFRDLVSIQDLNYRVPKLRRTGRIPPSSRGRSSQRRAGAPAQDPLARAFAELQDARQSLADAQRRYDQAQAELREVMKENLSPEFLESLVEDDGR